MSESGIHGFQPESDFAYVPLTMGVDTAQVLATTTRKLTASQSTVTAFFHNAANKFVLDHATVDQGGLNLTTTFQFDQYGNVTGVDGPLAGTGDTTNYIWDANRRLTHEVLPDPDGAGPAPRTATRWTYDNDGLFLSTEKGSATAASDAAFTPLLRTEFTHDAVGNRVREIVRDLSNGNAILSLTDTSYEGNDRPECVAIRMDTSAFGAATATPACSLTSSGGGADGPDRITKTVYTSRGEVQDLIRGLGLANVPGTVNANAIEHFTYTANGKRQTVADGNGNLTTLQYDGFDRLIRQLYPTVARPPVHVSDVADHEDYTYDPNDNRTSFTRRNGLTITYLYDALNRMTEKHLPGFQPANGPAIAATDIYFDYDGADRRIAARTVSPSGQGTILSYDNAGRLISDQTFGHNVTSAYDAAGHRTSVSVDGQATAYDYDLAGQLTSIRDAAQGSCPNSSALVCFTYDSLGRRTRLDRGNGGYATYHYDGAGRLDALTQAGPSGGMAPSIQTVSFNPASQVKTVTQANDPYAWVGRPPSAPSRAFDGKNRDAAFLSQPDGGYNDGNLTSDGARTLSYDAEDKLRHVGPAQGQTGTTLDLTYDPLGRLLTATATNGSATVTGFLYDSDRLVGEYGSNGTLLRRYVHGAGVDEPLVWYEGPVANWLHADRQGSVIGVSAASAQFAAYTYGPYGEPAAWGPSRFAYTGQIALPEAQLYHYKARVYDPMMGRFLQTDPVGQLDDLDLYGYTRQDPTDRADPTGTVSPGPHGPSYYDISGGDINKAAEYDERELRTGLGADVIVLSAPIVGWEELGYIALGGAVIDGGSALAQGKTLVQAGVDGGKGAFASASTAGAAFVGKLARIPKALALGAGSYNASRATGESRLPAAVGAATTSGASFLKVDPAKSVYFGRGAARVAEHAMKEVRGSAFEKSLIESIKTLFHVKSASE